jgi:hypothetical protein
MNEFVRVQVCDVAEAFWAIGTLVRTFVSFVRRLVNLQGLFQSEFLVTNVTFVTLFFIVSHLMSFQ